MKNHEEIANEAFDAATEQKARIPSTHIESFVIGWLSGALAAAEREIERLSEVKKRARGSAAP